MEEQNKYTLTYDGNSISAGDSVGNVPDVSSEKYVSGQTVVLSGTPTYQKGAEDGNGDVLFIGWSLTDTAMIYGAGDTDAFKSVAIIPAVTFANANITVYAVWGYDKDGDGRPDVMGDQYAIYTFAGVHGSIDPNQTVTVEKNGSQAFAFSPDQKYAVDQIVIDGVIYLNNGSLNLAGYDAATKTYTFSNVQDDHSIVVTFSADEDENGIPDKYEDPDAKTYTIEAGVVGGNGRISPSGSITVREGERVVFTITPNTGYHISDVVVDGSSVGAVGSYTLSNVQGNHTIAAYFAKDSSGGVDPDPVPQPDYTLYYHSNFGIDKRFYQSDDSNRMQVRDYAEMSFLPQREGYTFVCWNTEADGSGKDYEPGDIYQVMGSSDHLYAQWAKDGYTPDDTGVSDWLNTKDHSAYLNGYSNGCFAPNNNMTRAEVAQMFYNLLLNKNVPVTVHFTDVAEDAWYAQAVNTLASLGIIQGVGNHQFAPERVITRAEFTVIAMRFTDLDTSGTNIFSDVNENDWFYEQVVGSIQYGWITGYGDGTFRPGNTITRAEVTIITNRMLGRVADEDYVDDHADELRTFPDVSVSDWAYYNIIEATNSHDHKGSGSSESWTGLNG